MLAFARPAVRTIGDMEQRFTPPFDDHTGHLADDLQERLNAEGSDADSEHDTRSECARTNRRLRDALNRASAGVYFGAPKGRYWALIDMGHALLDCNEVDGALRAYQEALLLEPGAPEPLYSLALLYGSEGESDDAIMYATQALRGALATPGAASQEIGAEILEFLISCEATDQVAAALAEAGWPAEITAAWLAHSV